MPGTPTARRNIRPGQLIWGSMIIDSVALRRPDGSMTPAMKKIFKGKAVEKLAYVLEVRENHVFAAYATTLGSATQLSRVVSEPDHWYPVFPAPMNGRLRSLDPVDGKAAWIYLGMPVVMSYEPIYVLDNGLSTESLRLVRQAMVHQRFELGE